MIDDCEGCGRGWEPGGADAQQWGVYHGHRHEPWLCPVCIDDEAICQRLDVLVAEVSPWRAIWRGGRLADVQHIEYPGRALACFQVGAWDHQRDRLEREPDIGALTLRLAEWVADDGDTYLRELPYLP
jgi:hypothetical protein